MQKELKATDSCDGLRAVLARYWGYDGFLPLQKEAMTSVLATQDSVVVLPTGGGKSLCFQAPAMCLSGMAVIVSPLISLMKDQVDTLQQCGISAAYINSSLTANERRKIAGDIRAGQIKILYVAPERLVQPQTIEFLKTASVSMIAIDEAHCISEWGHDFRPEYRELKLLREHFPGIGVHAYTATATERVRLDIAEQLHLNKPNFLVGSFDRKNLIYKVERRSQVLNQIRSVLKRNEGESGVIYCMTRAEVETTSEALNGLGYRTLPYHAGLTDETRHANQEAFLEDKVDIIVATVAFGMGIDKSNVRFVIHAGMPKSLEAYQQESGRAGRDGLPAECWLFYSLSDLVRWKKMMQGGEAGATPAALASLEAMGQFCSSAMCRHQTLSRYFGQTLAGPSCNACDICLGDIEFVDDALIVGQKILSSVVRQKERFGGEYTALVLRGSTDSRILQNGHDQLSTYGLLRHESQKTIRDWIEQLAGQGFLEKIGEYNVLQITEEGRRLLKGQVTPRLLKPSETAEKSERGTKRRTSVADDSWEGVDHGLFDELRGLRRTIANEQGVPPYIVFSDTALRDMARKRPTTSSNFRQVKGVGDKKAKDFGAEFIGLIVAYCQKKQLDTDVLPVEEVTIRAAERAPQNKNSPTTAAAVYPQFRKGMSVQELCEKLGRAPSTMYSYLNDFLRADKVTDASPWVNPSLIPHIETAAAKVGTERLKPIFDQLGGEVSYNEIRLVVTCMTNRIEAES